MAPLRREADAGLHGIWPVHIVTIQNWLALTLDKIREAYRPDKSEALSRGSPGPSKQEVERCHAYGGPVGRPLNRCTLDAGHTRECLFPFGPLPPAQPGQPANSGLAMDPDPDRCGNFNWKQQEAGEPRARCLLAPEHAGNCTFPTLPPRKEVYGLEEITSEDLKELQKPGKVEELPRARQDPPPHIEQEKPTYRSNPHPYDEAEAGPDGPSYAPMDPQPASPIPPGQPDHAMDPKIAEMYERLNGALARRGGPDALNLRHFPAEVEAIAREMVYPPEDGG